MIFQGCANCTLDAGAIRVVNNTPLAVTVNSVVVRFGSCSFDIWPHGTSVPSGNQLVDTQMGPDFEDGCPNDGSFDTSDVGPNGADWAGVCQQSGVHPEVDVTVDGVTTPYTDSGQVLNTGGVDKASCNADPNESTQWTPIGSVPCPGATLTLAPPSQTATLGGSATVTGTLADTCGVGLQGASVHFTVGSGPNAGASGDGTTDPNGQATFTYPGSTAGTDALTASVSNPAGTITSNSVSVVWAKRTATLAVAAATSDFDDAVTVSGVLSDSLGPISGQPVTLTLNGAESCTGTTGSDGTASCSITPQEAAGSYTLTATAPETATDLAATGSGAFTVTLEETALVYTGPNRAANTHPYTFSGTLTEDGTTPIDGRTVTFTLGSGASAQTCQGTTDASGNAGCTVTVNQPASATSLPVAAAFAGDAYYDPATAAAATVGLNYLTGDAYGIASSGLVTISKAPHAGPVSTSVSSSSTPPCVAKIAGLISADTLCASVVTTAGRDSTATASLQDAQVGVLGIPAIKIGAVQSSSVSTCSGSTGDTSVTSITVGGIPLNINLHPAPNTTISVLGITLVLNEQVPEAGADHGLTVNAVHIKALGLLDVVLASSTSDIHNC